MIELITLLRFQMEWGGYCDLTNSIELISIDWHFKSKPPPDSGRGSPSFRNPPIDFHSVIIVALDFTAAVAPVDVRLIGQRAKFPFSEINVIGRECSIVGEAGPPDK